MKLPIKRLKNQPDEGWGNPYQNKWGRWVWRQEGSDFKPRDWPGFKAPKGKKPMFIERGYYWVEE